MTGKVNVLVDSLRMTYLYEKDYYVKKIGREKIGPSKWVMDIIRYLIVPYYKVGSNKQRIDGYLDSFRNIYKQNFGPAKFVEEFKKKLNELEELLDSIELK